MNVLRFLSSTVLTRELKCINCQGRRSYKRCVAPMHKELTIRKKNEPRQPEPIRSSFIDWNRDSELYAFNIRLSEHFNLDLLNRAFTCKSYVTQEEEKQRQLDITDPHLSVMDNTEFIVKGRELVSKIVQQYLRETLPHVPEEGIITIHDYLLSDTILASASLHIGTKDIILTEEHPITQTTLAETFCAIVAALAENNDTGHVSSFVSDFLITTLAEKDLSEIWCPTDAYAMLENILSKRDAVPVEARIIGHGGKQTVLAVYRIGIYANKLYLGSGCAQSIEEAKHIAALNILYRMFGLSDSSRPIKFDKKIEVL